jgi:hypothetical protein
MSSLVFLAFSVILFIIVFGIMFLIVPVILGKFFGVLDPLLPSLGNAWQGVYTANENEAKYLTPLIPTIGLFILIIKVLMTASVKGND